MPSGEVFYGKYDPDGTLAWSRSSPPLDVLWLQADAIGACYVAGNFGYYFTGNFGYPLTNADFDGIALTAPTSSTTQYLLRLNTTTLPRLNIQPDADSVAVSWS